MTIGERIRNKRELLNISQTDLAKRVGVSKQTLYKYENDIIANMPLIVIEKLSHHLCCSPAYIAGWDDEQEREALYSAIERLDKSEKEKVLCLVNALLAQRGDCLESLS